MKKLLTLSLINVICVFVCMAQNQTSSLVINPDNSVTFNFHMPDADEVILKGSFIPSKEYLKTEIGTLSKSGKVKMEKQGNLWTYTTDVLPSEFYTYYFEVGAKHYVDPKNPNVVRDIADSLSYFTIKGGIADDYITRNVPHGVIKKVWYPSTLNGMKKRRMSVYLPSAYNPNKQKRFPVLYLLHGSGGDEEAWEGCGRVAQILDNLIADRRCEPMIVVMPNGNAGLSAAPGSDPKNPNQKPSAMNTNSMLGQIESVFMDEVVDYVDENYRTINDKAHRAIAGLSLGGLHTLFISMNNPTKFDYVGLFSAQTTNALNNKRIGSMQKIGEAWNELKSNLPFIGGGSVDRKISSLTSDELSIYDDVDNKLKAQFSAAPKLYYIAVGRDDFVKKLNDDLRLKLDAKGYKYYYNETDGGHTWENWRRYLVDFLPRIFK